MSKPAARATLQVLFLDADCMPLLDPEFLFEWPEFKEKGNIFFPGAVAAAASAAAVFFSSAGAWTGSAGLPTHSPSSSVWLCARASAGEPCQCSQCSSVPCPVAPTAEHHAEQVRLFQYWGLYNPWAEGRDRKSMPLQAESGMLLMNR